MEIAEVDFYELLNQNDIVRGLKHPKEKQRIFFALNLGSLIRETNIESGSSIYHEDINKKKYD